jgi:hypothetical protein
MLRVYVIVAIAFTSLVAGSGPATSPLYTLERAATLPSTDTDWDYIKLQQGTPRLFMARRRDGLTVFDVDKNTAIATVPNSAGANGPLILPQFNRGYAAMTDGSLLSFRLDTLQVIDRLKLDSGGLNGVVYDPATRRAHAVVGSRTTPGANWYTVDAATGKRLSTRTFPYRKMDDPVPDGQGHLFAPARYDRVILKLDSRTLNQMAQWNVDCDQVVVVEFQKRTNRVLVGCRGDHPVFLALDPVDGREVARVPIGKGVDGMAIDELRHRIVTSNGADSSLSVIQQSGADSYQLLGNIQTRPQARVIQLDERTGRLFTVTADATFPAPAGGTPVPPVFHPNSFTVLTYRPQ